MCMCRPTSSQQMPESKPSDPLVMFGRYVLSKVSFNFTSSRKESQDLNPRSLDFPMLVTSCPPKNFPLWKHLYRSLLMTLFRHFHSRSVYGSTCELLQGLSSKESPSSLFPLDPNNRWPILHLSAHNRL